MATLLASRYGLVGGTLYLATPAHFAEEYGAVHAIGSPRGENGTTQAEDGLFFRAKPAGPVRFSLPILVFGDRDANNLAYADPHDGLRQNMDALETAFDTTSAAVEFRDVLPTGGYRSADFDVTVDEVVSYALHTVRVVATFTQVGGAGWIWTAP